MPAVLIEDVHKKLRPLEVLKGVSLSVEPGQVVAIIGRSGSGKSHAAALHQRARDLPCRRIEVAGHTMTQDPKRLRELRKDVGIVFQSYNLFPHLTVGQNIMLSPRITQNVPQAEAMDAGRTCWRRSGCRRNSTAIPTTSRAGSSSASRSPVRWRCSRR
jgi:polar amino acid transport system ATP-binding protein